MEMKDVHVIYCSSVKLTLGVVFSNNLCSERVSND